MVARSINGTEYGLAGIPDENVFIDEVPSGSQTMSYRVAGAKQHDYTWEEFESFDYDWETLDSLDWDWIGDQSEWEYSAQQIVGPEIEAPDVYPAGLFHAGKTTVLNWNQVENATGYILQAKLDTDSDYVTIYTGSGTSLEYHAPKNNTSVIFRIKSYIEHDYTWEELDDFDRTWEEWDSLDWMWAQQESKWSYSIQYEIIPNRPPIISGQDSDLGVRTGGFSLAFTIVDPDPGNTIGFTAHLDGEVIQQSANAQQGVEYTLQFSDDRIFSMAEGSIHSITILAWDEQGATSRRAYTFTYLEDLIPSAVFYLFRDGMRIARMTSEREYYDYTVSMGSHSYFIRAIDKYGRFRDSNTVTISVEINNPIIAPYDDPANMQSLILRRGSPPEIHRNEMFEYSEIQFEGRERVTQVGKATRKDTYALSFSSVSREDYYNLRALSDKIMIYRDQAGHKDFVIIPPRQFQYYGRSIGKYDLVMDFSLSMTVTSHTEEIPYD